MKKKKAAQLLNKAKLKYVRYTKYLDYEYNKYGVKSSEVLRNNWSRYTNYQTANKRYKRLSEYTSGLLERLDYMLNKYSITEIDYILENSDMLSTKLRRTEIYKTIMDEKQQCENNLAEIMNEQKKVMSILNGIKYKNEKHIPLIDKIVEEKIIAKSM